MVGPTIRPTFEVLVAGDGAAVVERLRQRLADGVYPVRTQAVGAHFTLFPAERDVHFWSPWLHIEVESRDDGGTRVFGRFSPRPSIWTGFMCGYFGLATAGFFAGVWGASQMMLGQRPVAIWITLGCAVVMALMLWASQIGQRLAHEQMAQMQAMVGEILGASDAASSAVRSD